MLDQRMAPPDSPKFARPTGLESYHVLETHCNQELRDASGNSKTTGTLEPDKRANFIVLDADPPERHDPYRENQRRVYR
jgi:hypothetical protein